MIRVWVLSRLFVVFASTLAVPRVRLFVVFSSMLAVTRVKWGHPRFTATILSFVTAMSFVCLSIAQSIHQPLSCDSLKRIEMDSHQLCYTIRRNNIRTACSDIVVGN